MWLRMRGTTNQSRPVQPDDEGPDFEQQDVLLREEAWARHELARAAELAARMGGHPEKAEDVERGLLEVAGLNRFDLAA